MRLKSLSLFFIFVQGLCANAQSPWTESSYREAAFPTSTYYVSYFHLLNEGNLDDCVSKTLLGAQSMLANSIYSEVSSVSHSSISASNIDGEYSENETFVNEFSTAASAQLVNVHLEHCYDKVSNTVHAIAYVKKQDLSDFCETKLNTGFSALTGKLNSIDDFINKGYKSEAKSLAAEALEEIRVYPLFLSQLITVGLSRKNPDEYSNKLEQISKQILQYKADLEHCLSIHICAKNSSTHIKGEILSSKCKGLLSENGCSFVDTPENADFVISIDYDTRTSSYTEVGYFAFADINLTIKRNRDDTLIFDDLLSIKGGAGTEEKAHRKAIDQSAKSICDKVLTSIK